MPCLSLAHEMSASVALKWCVMRKVSATGDVMCTTVEQESVRLETDTKRSEVPNLFS